ncbi:GTPase ObgE [Alicyclobacillus sp. SP_1]|uniref:GTPase ObgE n=1 Tax=Alicyclobacillus sp. SP_1 TaxID=2942475 RepID=UPI0021587723|nr:GTPase ObgE [Alicyclobacillus sp. SP_1]
MFIDKARIYVKGGDGGNGIVSYRREKYVPLGGPAGGDGGRGGSVVLVVDEGLRTLIDFKYQRHMKAKPGERGKTKNQHGANAEDMMVKVPPGTVVRDADTGEFLGDLVVHGQRLTVALGGRGGRGNTRFASEANKAPDMAERGEPGQERWLDLELKVLADVGLIGFPSVGKSTLLSVVSAAKSKVAAYPFTTLTPELGVVQVREGESFVMADLPGLIEGAHEGHGLGFEFLRHIERTRVLVHVIDMAAVDGRNPIQDYEAIERELMLYAESLGKRPRVVVANKMDLPQAEDNLQEFKRTYPDIQIFCISGATGLGVRALIDEIEKKVQELPLEARESGNDDSQFVEERKTYHFEERTPFKICKDGLVYVVESKDLEKLIKMTNFSQGDAVVRFQRILKQRGVDESLRKSGAVDGDTIRIGEMEFDFVE